MAHKQDIDFDAALAWIEPGGLEFEELALWFLLNDPEWGARVKRAWLWDDWPDNWGLDRGIDLIAELHDASIVAVQAKHYSQRYRITKPDVDKFLSESNRPVISERLLVATTDKMATTAGQVIDGQEKPVTLLLREGLEASPVRWSAYFDRKLPARPEPLKPRADQNLALHRIEGDIGDGGRAQVIMPCGTGKSVLGVWAADRLRARTVVVLVPTLVLVRQLTATWRTESKRRFRLLKVCSERGSDNELAAADLEVATVGPDVTTKPEEIAAFLNGGGLRLIIGTYDSSPKIAAAIKSLAPGFRFDLAIGDEAHHLAGDIRPATKAILHDDKIPALRRLFFTATPTLFKADVRARGLDASVHFADMRKDWKLFGRTSHRMTFKQAVDLKLLCPIRIACMPIDDDDVAELVRRRNLITPDHGDTVTDAHTFAGEIACLRAMASYNCRRLVAFHPSVEDSKRFTAELDVALGLLPGAERPAGFQALHVDGYMKRHARERTLRRFRSADESSQLLSNVRLLAEGVDEKRIDAICLMDAGHNPAWIAQAVGRAMRTAPRKKEGIVVLPVVVRRGQDPFDAVRGSAHRRVYEVLAALRSIDRDIVHTIDHARVELGPTGHTETRAPSHWSVDVATDVDEAFAEAVRVNVLDILADGAPRERRTVTAESDAQPPAASSPQAEVARRAQTAFSDPRGRRLGVNAARKHRRSLGGLVPDAQVLDGFPIGRWWTAMLRDWEAGRLDGKTRSQCAKVFNWICVAQHRFPQARAEMAKLDTVALGRRIDAWIAARPADLDEQLDALARLDRQVPWREKVRTKAIVDMVPEDLPAERRLELAVTGLKLAGEAMTVSANHLPVAVRGFRDALVSPGTARGRTIREQIDIGGRLVAPEACYQCGWDAGQAIVRLMENARPTTYSVSDRRNYDDAVYEPSKRETSHERHRRRRRAAERREQPDDRRPRSGG
jgi:superfamily II DNA or RNA helicase